MLRKSRTIRAIVVGFCAAFIGSSAHAVILSANANRNTSAPTGALANTGWQWQGQWRGFLGTPVSKKFFITAGHAGGNVGTKFYLGSRVFTTTAMWDDPNSDLRIYSVNKKFDSWAPMYTGDKEVGKTAVVFGRGTQRGAEVRVNTVLKGWEWGTDDQVQSWGLNSIDQVLAGDPGEGSLLQLDFDQNGVANEGMISAGDSGGGVFIYNKTTKRYELTGINYSADGPFKRSAGGADFSAALFDLGGIYYGGNLIADTSIDNPSRFFLSRISTNQAWINGVFNGTISATSSSDTSGKGVPEPAAGTVLVSTVCLVSQLKRRRFR